MAAIRGKLTDGVARPEELLEGHDGQDVVITFLDDSPSAEAGAEPASLSDIVEKWKSDTGISDLAHRHDHYLHGTPKRDRAVRAVFVDTAAWLALFNTRDAYHSDAVKVMRSLESDRVVLARTEFVLLEVADALSATTHRARAGGILNDLRRTPFLRIEPASHRLLEDGWSLFQQRPDKDWGLTDCTRFVVMQRDSMVEAFTSDRHFEQAGCTNLL